jgi:hypothetical protein
MNVIDDFTLSQQNSSICESSNSSTTVVNFGILSPIVVEEEFKQQEKPTTVKYDVSPDYDNMSLDKIN